jgi:integrase
VRQAGRNGVIRTVPEVYGTRTAAQRVLWNMADDGRADFYQDERFRAMVLVAAFASLRWGEVTALTRSDFDLKAGAVRVRAAFTQRRPMDRRSFLARPSREPGAGSSASLGRLFRC